MDRAAKKFGLIGAAGYIAPRHMKAIKETGNTIVAALDKSDSVGIIDSHFPNADYFTEFERFDRYVDLQRRGKDPLDYITICSPNYLHDSHMRFSLRSGADAICEKPLVLNPWNIDGLLDVEKDTGCKINTILQLRVHPSIISIKEKISTRDVNSKCEVDLTYITSRGKWYQQSWKGDESKSGGIATNIGVHFFDMLHFIFGELQEIKVHLNEQTKSAGYLEYANARVRWYLSIDHSDLPSYVQAKQQRTYRSITLNGDEIEFSDGFTDLHTISYKKILAGDGFGLEDNRVAIETVSSIREAEISRLNGDYHPFVKQKTADIASRKYRSAV